MATKIRGSKRIDVWKYEKEGKKIDVPVYMVDKKKADYHDYGGEKHPDIFFRVYLQEPEVDVWDADLSALKKKAFAEIDSKLKIDWKPFLIIEIKGNLADFYPKNAWGDAEGQDKDDPPDDRDSCCALVEVNAKTIELAEMSDGTKLHRYPQRGYNSRAGDGWPESGPIKDSYWGKRDRAHQFLVPDTEAYRLVLDKLVRDLDQLRTGIVDTLTKNASVALSDLVLLNSRLLEPNSAKRGKKG